MIESEHIFLVRCFRWRHLCAQKEPNNWYRWRFLRKPSDGLMHAGALSWNQKNENVEVHYSCQTKSDNVFWVSTNNVLDCLKSFFAAHVPLMILDSMIKKSANHVCLDARVINHENIQYDLTRSETSLQSYTGYFGQIYQSKNFLTRIKSLVLSH